MIGGGDARGPSQPASAPDAFELWVAALAPRWQAPIRSAMASRDRYTAMLGQVAPGPTRERLEEFRPTLDRAVQRIADAVWRAINAKELAAGLDVRRATDELKAARRDLEVVRQAGGDVAAAEAKVQTLAERHRAVNRAANLAEDAGEQIDDLGVRLDTAVAHATMVALRAGHDDGVGQLDRELEDVVQGLGALDAALEELGP
jgi:hypothetical protein